jgi:hypothetical protein
MIKNVSAEDVAYEAEAVAKSLVEKWPGISTTVSMQTPSSADAWVIVSGAGEHEDEISWDAAELEWQTLSARGIDIITVFDH